MAMHTTGDGIVWKPAVFKGSDVWARVATEADTTPYVSEASGKACVKYKNTPQAQWYWCTPDLVELKAPGASNDGSRRSKRLRGEEGRAELEREEEERKKLPREANNGKLYGVMLGNASRKAYVRGKDFKQQCAKCGTVLDNEPCVGFIEGEKSKTVKRRYGDDPRDSKSWKGSFSFTDRMFSCLGCWEVPQSALKSLRGFIDIAGYADMPEDLKEKIRDKIGSDGLGWVEDAQPAINVPAS